MATPFPPVLKKTISLWDFLCFWERYFPDIPWRYGVSAEVAVPAHEIKAWALAPEGALSQNLILKITGHLFGLQGVQSPLPSHDWERFLGHSFEDSALTPFLDFFHHALLKTWYQSLSRYRLTQKVRPSQGYCDVFSKVMLGLTQVGYGVESLEPSQFSPLVVYAPLLTGRFLGIRQLRQLLKSTFSVLDLEIIGYIPHKIPIPHTMQSQLSTRKNCNQLGVNGVCGRAVMSFQSKIQIVLWLERLEPYLPHTPLWADLLGFIQKFLPKSLVFSIKLIAKSCRLPLLSSSLENSGYLGWNTALVLRSQAMMCEVVARGFPLPYEATACTHLANLFTWQGFLIPSSLAEEG